MKHDCTVLPLVAATLMLSIGGRAHGQCDPIPPDCGDPEDPSRVVFDIATGQDADGDGRDDNWSVTYPNGAFFANAPIVPTPMAGWRGSPALASNTGPFGSGSRYPVLGDGRWIGGSFQRGTYVYRYEFTLDAYTTYEVVGEWAADNTAEVLLNGNPTGFGSVSANATPPAPWLSNSLGTSHTCAVASTGLLTPICRPAEEEDPCGDYLRCGRREDEFREIHPFRLSYSANPEWFNPCGLNVLEVRVSNPEGVSGFLITGGPGTSVGAAEVSACPEEPVCGSQPGDPAPPCECLVTDFEGGDDAGGTADVSIPGAGFTVVGSPGPAILFPSSGAIPCEDDDLATPGYGPNNTEARGDVLIIKELASSCDGPDDERDGGTLTFSFDPPIDFASVGLLDIEEEGGSITVTAPDGSSCVAAIPADLDNGWQELSCELAGATGLVVELAGSGAVTEINCSPAVMAFGVGREVYGEVITASGATLSIDFFGDSLTWGGGSLELSAPSLSAERGRRPVSARRLSVASGVSREVPAPTSSVPLSLSPRGGTRQRPGVERDVLRGSIVEVVESDAGPDSLLVRGTATWNGRGGHVFELELDAGAPGQFTGLRLAVRGSGGAIVYQVDERLRSDRLDSREF
ncbi:MAG: hypothetical protein AAF533_29090 [Acidobacteriota bacterium]